MKIRVYISGAISNLPHNDAKEVFNKAETLLNNQNFKAVNPFDNGLDKDEPWANHMRADIKALLDCDCIYMLSNWRNSKGARLEHKIAIDLGMGIIYQSNEY